MLRLATACAMAILPLSVAAASPPIYPSFATAPAKRDLAAPGYPSFGSLQLVTPKTVTDITVPGARYTYPSAINNSGVVIGTWDSSLGPNGREGGFLRTADGTITILKSPLGKNLFPVSINAQGDISGWFNKAGSTGYFVRGHDGHFTQIMIPDFSGLPGNPGAVINNHNYVAGTFVRTSSNGTSHQEVFLRAPDGGVTRIDAITAQSISMNASETITGEYGGVENSAFVWSPISGLTKFHIGHRATIPAGINASGTIVGAYEHADPRFSGPSVVGFIRAASGAITTFQLYGFDTNPAAINDAGDVVGTYSDHNGIWWNFKRHPDGKLITYALPPDHFLSGINNRGVMIGWSGTSNTSTHGFIMVP
jgi:hypothetical protein